jgi:hypothetical protein
MGETARGTIASRFDLDVVVERWLKIYGDVIRKP